MTAADERYEVMCQLVGEHGRIDALAMLRAFDADPDLVEEAVTRWDRHHVRNVAGRLEGTIEELPDGRWKAHAECGPRGGESKTLPGEELARRWVLHPDVVEAHLAGGGS